MKTLGFYGASDDLFCADVDGKQMHDQCDPRDTMAFLVASASQGDGLIVTGTYAPDPIAAGTWVIGVTMRNDTSSIPAWPMRFADQEPDGTNTHPYSPRLIIFAPHDVVITELEG